MTADGANRARRASDRSVPADDRPLASVVLPTYDRASVLSDAIESVLEQSHDALELVVVDGGSTDRTPAVVDSYDDPRLEYVRRDAPAGVSAARNRGIDRSSGEFVAFIDSDDRWRPDALERRVTALREAPPAYGVAYCGIEKRAGEPITRTGESGDVRKALRHLAVPTYTSTLAVRRDAIAGVGGFDEALPCFEDWDLCLRLARERRFVYVDEPLVAKGEPGDNVSADPDRLVAAIERLEAKYDLPDGTRARLLADAGATHCEAGRVDDGRRYLERAIRLDPTRGNAIAAYLLALTGSSAAYDAGMGGVYALQQRLERALARVRVNEVVNR
ncbi:glycosyltransferase family 2 protein [Natrinema sp. 74]|uniref:glycosyltransferase family 2 protein n=1 Tax=Natrinema sp. 74 TaxID=3384159 RepID=UPI0038D35661